MITPQAARLRTHIESALADRIPSALTPQPRQVLAVVSTGIAPLDDLLGGGFPLGAISEVVGPECSGRSTLALSFLASITAQGKACAWVDASDALSPECAAASGVNLQQLLWVRCGASVNSRPASDLPKKQHTVPESAQQNSYTVTRSTQGTGSTHPRGEVRGLDAAVEGLMAHKDKFLRNKNIGTPAARNLPLIAAHQVAANTARVPQRRIEQIATDRLPARRGEAVLQANRQITQVRSESSKYTASKVLSQRSRADSVIRKPWSRLDQALRATDLLLHAGGFPAVVLDLGSISREDVLKIPLTTWFRYRAAVEKSQTSLLLLTQESCARSSAGLVLQLDPATELAGFPRVLNGLSFKAQVVRQKCLPAQVIDIRSVRKPPTRERRTDWHSVTAWCAGDGL